MQINNNRYKHIIWDWNGTLLDDAWLCVDVMNGLLADRNMKKINHQIYQELFTFPVEYYYEKLGFDFNKESFEKVGTEFIINYEKRRHECKLHSSSIKVLKQLSSRGFTHSLLSAYKQSTLDELVDYFGVRQFFIRVVGLGDHYAKSKVNNGKLLIGGLPFAQNEILLVGDTLHDFEVAESIGVDCVLIPCGHQNYERLKKCGAEIIRSLEELLVFLNN